MARAATFAAATLLAALALDNSWAQARTRIDCERDYSPSVGQPGKDVIWVPVTVQGGESSGAVPLLTDL